MIRTGPGRPRRPPLVPAEAQLNRLPWLLAAAAAYALAEILVTLAIGGFFSWGRAEALLFLGFRPWLLLAAAALASRFGRRARLGFYACALLLAAISESLLLLGLGASDPWPEAGRGLAAGAVLALIIDLLIQLGVRFGRRYGRSLATGALALLFVAGGLAPYEAVVIGREERPAATKSDLMVMTALPLRWSEQGPLDPNGRPAAAYGALGEEFSIRLLDRLDRAVLSSGRLLLLAQPRALDPAELVALDQWVRAGGRALILTDPMLAWPSELALGDIRRPPAIGLLDPLLSHWHLSLAGDPEPRLVTRHIEAGGTRRRLVMFGPGRFAADGDACKVGRTPEIARCRLARGEALLLADADMMHDRLWVGPGPRGAERHARRSDNPLLVADWLDGLAGNRRPRRAGPVQWLDPAADWRFALLLALLPLLVVAAPALILRIRRC
jgi:hypothetical protein